MGTDNLGGGDGADGTADYREAVVIDKNEEANGKK